MTAHLEGEAIWENDDEKFGIPPKNKNHVDLHVLNLWPGIESDSYEKHIFMWIPNKGWYSGNGLGPFKISAKDRYIGLAYDYLNYDYPTPKQKKILDKIDSGDYILVPKKPNDAVLMSIAIRLDHGLGVPGYYDQDIFKNSNRPTHQQILECALDDARRAYEEVVYEGFYKNEE
jgi:hypothetical protein